jgi:transducin (beta)-like 1
VTLLSYSVIQVLNANVFSFTQKRKATLNDSAVLDAANDDDNDDDVPEWDSNEVIKLEGHDNEVFVCSWHPSADLIATGSGDATARLWHVPRNVSTQQAASTAISSVKVLRHVSAGNANKSRDVTTLDWNRNGLLATASYDGVARIWKSDGELVKELVGHKGPIFALKWNKSGTHLLSGSFDKSAVIWDAATGALRQQFAFHTAPTLDVDWRSDTSFASCSTDKHILVCELGRNTPLNDFVGHSDEVNAITWDATGRLLASCSDDRTAKLWNCDSPNAVATLSEHAKEIYTIEWAPTGAGTANPSARPLLASASFDATIKLWDPETQQCVRTLSKHTDPVYSVSFSPDGQYLASGSLDKCVNIWSVRDGTLLRRYRGGGGIFEVRWNAAGDRLGACFADKSVVVIDTRKL